MVDRYRYWRRDAIIADLARRAHGFHVAIENWEHDFNIGTVVRNANAFGAAGVHIVGRRRWNRRGAMVTDRYLSVTHHPAIEDLIEWADGRELPLIGIDNLPGSVPLETFALPERCVMLFGQEGPGLSAAAREAVIAVCSIAQFGSTRSINAGVASGIAMHAWVRRARRGRRAGSGRVSVGRTPPWFDREAANWSRGDCPVAGDVHDIRSRPEGHGGALRAGTDRRA